MRGWWINLWKTALLGVHMASCVFFPTYRSEEILILGNQGNKKVNERLEQQAREWKPRISVIYLEEYGEVPRFRTRFGDWIIGGEMVGYYLTLQKRLEEAGV